MKTEMLNLYREFVYHRQHTLIEKIKDPLHVSSILGYNKFTNVQRVFDRVSQYELKEVIYEGGQEPIEVLKRIFLFNQFKTEYFWHCSRFYLEEYENEGDFYSNEFSSPHFETHVSTEHLPGKLFTNAYVVPGKAGESKVETIHQRCLIFNTHIDELQQYIKLKEIRLLFSALKKIPGISDFLASQVCFDFLWHCTKDWKPLIVLGVGAVRGAQKLELIKSPKPTFGECLYALNTAQNHLLAEDYPYIYANNQLIPIAMADIQNTFCEFDKYMRLVHPEVKTSSNAPTRIKNHYKPGKAVNYVVPGHWVGSDERLVPID